MTQQYVIHTGNALTALDRGDLDIVRRQIKLAKLASEKRLAAKRMAHSRTTITTSIETAAEAEPEAAEIAATPAAAKADNANWLPPLPRLRGRVDLRHTRTQFYLVLLAWSMGAALVSNSLPPTSSLNAARNAAPAAWSTQPISGLPVKGRITSGIGWRTHPVTGKRSYHAGLDIAAPIGTPIHATGAGTVLFAGWRNDRCGNGVIIHHGDRKTVYCHMQSVAPGLKAGDTLPARAVIGYVGQTGRATGPHVHYEIQLINKGGKQAQQDKAAYTGVINASAKEFGVDPLLVQAVIWKESTWNPAATSQSGAQGMMQLMPETGLNIARRLKMPSPDLYDPATNIRLGTAYLADLLRQFGRLDQALAAYNAGPGAVRQHRGIPPYPETRSYVSKITGYYNNLKEAKSP